MCSATVDVCSAAVADCDAVSEEGLYHLRRCKHLVYLDLSGLSCVSDAVLDQLHGMQLEELIMDDGYQIGNVTDDGVTRSVSHGRGCYSVSQSEKRVLLGQSVTGEGVTRSVSHGRGCYSVSQSRERVLLGQSVAGEGVTRSVSHGRGWYSVSQSRERMILCQSRERVLLSQSVTGEDVTRSVSHCWLPLCSEVSKFVAFSMCGLSDLRLTRFIQLRVGLYVAEVDPGQFRGATQREGDSRPGGHAAQKAARLTRRHPQSRR